MPRPTTYNSRYKTELSPRQGEVLALIGRGKTNQEIADALGISLDGAKYHVSEILAKLEVATREEAAELWRAERRPAARVGRWARGLVAVLSLRPVMIGTAIAGAACATAGIALLTLPIGGDGASAERRACEPWQMRISATTQLGDKSSTASVQTGAYAIGGPSCSFTGAVTLSFTDATGNVLAIEGNGLQLPVEGGLHWIRMTFGTTNEPTVVAVDDPDGAQSGAIPAAGGLLVTGNDGRGVADEGGTWHQALWWNWCGAYRGPVTVHVVDVGTGGPVPDAYFSNPPRCDDPSKPSMVVADWR